jgi:hypothetical protein
MSEDREIERERLLPEHETDTDTGVGGGLMSTGGTVTDRGTGEVGGQSQGGPMDDGGDEPSEGLAEATRGVGVVAAGPPGGGATPYVAAYAEPRDEEGSNLDDADNDADGGRD